MIIRNAAILQAIFIANIVRHVQLPLSSLHGLPTGLDRLPGFLQGGISADKPPAVFWHRRTGTNAQRFGGSVASRHAGKLFGERGKDLVAGPPAIEREGHSVSLSVEPPISLELPRSVPNEVPIQQADNQQSTSCLNITSDLITRPLTAELEGVPLPAHNAHGASGFIPPPEYTLEVIADSSFGTSSEVHMSRGRDLPSLIIGVIPSNGSLTPRTTIPIEDAAELLTSHGLLALLLEVLVFLVDLSLADVYIAWLSKKLHPRRKEETRKFLCFISVLQDKVFKESFDMFPSASSRSRQLLPTWVDTKHTMASFAPLGKSIRLILQSPLAGIGKYTRPFVSNLAVCSFSTMYNTLFSRSNRFAESCHLWVSCLRNFLSVAIAKTSELVCQSNLLLVEGGMISKGNFMAKLQVYRGVSFTGCKAMLRQLCDKAMHRITLTIATLGPLRRCYVFLFQSLRVLWAIISSGVSFRMPGTGSVRVGSTTNLNQTAPRKANLGRQEDYSRRDSSFQTHTFESRLGNPPGRAGAYMPPNKRPDAKRYTEKLEAQTCTLARLAEWQEEREFGRQSSHDVLDAMDIPLPDSPMSPQVDAPICDTPTIPSWRPNRYHELPYSSIGLGRPRSLQFIRDHRAPSTEADTAVSWRRCDDAGATEDTCLNRRASLDFQTLKRRTQCKTFIEALPTLLADGDDSKSATSSRPVSWGSFGTVKDSERREGTEHSDQPLLEPAFDLRPKGVTAQRAEGHELTTERDLVVPPVVSNGVEPFVSPSNMVVQKSLALPIIEEVLGSSDEPLAAVVKESINALSLEITRSPAVHEEHQSRKCRSHRQTSNKK